METIATRIALRAWSFLVIAFLLFPIVLIGVYAFNKSNVQGWPITEFSTQWWGTAWHNEEIRNALWLSTRTALVSTGIAIVLGSAAAFGVHRFRFFGRETISFLVILPIALPGIITGMALNSFFVNAKFIDFLHVGFFDFSESHAIPHFGIPWTIVIGHATFCIVIVYNNALARLRRTQTSLLEASMDLGADGWQTFRYVTLPMVATALVAGGLLAFALSFDEIIVTRFTLGAGDETLPIWIFNNLFRGQQLPITNVVAVLVVLISIIPVYLAHRLSREEGGATARGAAPVPAEATATP
jgi:putative spermidine/putrescine transport system permease protein